MDPRRQLDADQPSLRRPRRLQAPQRWGYNIVRLYPGRGRHQRDRHLPRRRPDGGQPRLALGPGRDRRRRSPRRATARFSRATDGALTFCVNPSEVAVPGRGRHAVGAAAHRLGPALSDDLPLPVHGAAGRCAARRLPAECAASVVERHALVERRRLGRERRERRCRAPTSGRTRRCSAAPSAPPRASRITRRSSAARERAARSAA